MLIDVVTVHMVQMTIMQEINVALVADRRMAAIRSVNVWMVAVLRAFTSRHDQPPAVFAMLSRSIAKPCDLCDGPRAITSGRDQISERTR